MTIETDGWLSEAEGDGSKMQVDEGETWLSVNDLMAALQVAVRSNDVSKEHFFALLNHSDTLSDGAQHSFVCMMLSACELPWIGAVAKAYVQKGYNLDATAWNFNSAIYGALVDAVTDECLSPAETRFIKLLFGLGADPIVKSRHGHPFARKAIGACQVNTDVVLTLFNALPSLVRGLSPGHGGVDIIAQDKLVARVGDVLPLQLEIRRQFLRATRHAFCQHVSPVSDDILARLKEVGERFPNFAEVVSHIATELSSALISGSNAGVMQPILLLGDPGLGKTAFCKAIAAVLNRPYRFVDGATLTAGFVLAGSAMTWRGAGEGLVARALLSGEGASPLIVVDEIDKISKEATYSPVGPLYSLLEPVSAKCFVDEFLDLPLDASRIFWVFTANSARPLPDPLLDRMTVFEIRKPDEEQMTAVIQSVYSSLLTDGDGRFAKFMAPELSDEVIDVLRAETPRQVNKTLRNAISVAAYGAVQSGWNGHPLSLDVSMVKRSARKSDDKVFGFLPRNQSASPVL